MTHSKISLLATTQALRTAVMCSLAVAAVCLGACSGRTVVVVHEKPRPEARQHGQEVAADNHYTNGVKFFNRGKYKQAIHQFDMVIAKSPRHWEAHYYIGLCYRELNDYSSARNHLKYAERDCPNERASRCRLYVAIGVNWERSGDHAQARTSYGLALKYDKDFSDARAGLERLDHPERERKNADKEVKGKGRGKRDDG